VGDRAGRHEREMFMSMVYSGLSGLVNVLCAYARHSHSASPPPPFKEIKGSDEFLREPDRKLKSNCQWTSIWPRGIAIFLV